MIARKKVFSIILMMSLMINPFIAILNTGAVTQTITKEYSPALESSSSRDYHSVKILFDPNDGISKRTAENLYQELKHSGLILELEAVLALDVLTQFMSDSWMNIYVFHGTDNGLSIGQESMSWRAVSLLVESSSVNHHIFESCYSNILETMVDDDCNVYGLEGSIDAEIAQLSVLCELYEILNAGPNQKLADVLFGVTTNYFLTHLNTIVQRSINPQETLDGFYIDYGKDETDSRGPWGWIIDAIMALLLITGFSNNDWYTKNSTSLTVDKTKVNTGSTDTGNMKMEDMGNGNDETGKFPFDIPLEFDVDPRIGTGPWYMPDYVDLVFTIKAKDGKLDLAEVIGLKEIMKAAGYDVALELTPKLSATLRIGNFIEQIGNANPAIADNPFKFMGGSLSIDFGLKIGIPLATFLDYLIPGTGKTVKSIMDLLNMKVNLVNYLSLGLGMSYNATSEASKQDVTLKAGFGLDIAISLPSPASYIKKAIGVSLPLDFITLGAKLKATTGIMAQASFGHKGDSFKVGIFYDFFFKFYASIFWIFKFDVTKKWDDKILFPLYQSEGSSTNPPTNDHANLDLDNDGLWDNLEVSMGLDKTDPDTDDDGLTDGNEVLNYFTDPNDNDTDDDLLNDKEELALWYAVGLDPLADYDNDGTPSIMDYDSDNDGMSDRDELKGIYSVHWGETITTNPSLKDTDFDGFSDSEEWAYAGAGWESPHPDPRKYDSDMDGLGDYFEFNWYENFWGRGVPIDEILTADEDGDGLLDGEEFNYHTSPIDIDTDGDFDLDNDNFINSTEQALAVNNFIDGDFTDYGEIHGNTWFEWPWSLEGCTPPNPTPTNPLRADSDYDGVSDVGEYTAGTFPCLYDSDGDGLEDLSDALTFHANCTNPDADGDGIRDGLEVQYYNLTRGVSNETIASLHYLNNSDVDGDGVLDGHELQIGTDPLNWDTDLDGLSDGDELFYGTSPFVQDSDEDSLFDGPEVHEHLTNPLRRDSDNDGLTDAHEVTEQTQYIINFGNFTYFTDPNDPDSDDDNLTDGDEYYGWNWALDRRVVPGALTIDEPMIEEDDEWILTPRFNAPDPYRARFQTHPMNPDTDFDGLPDGLEKDIVLSPVTNDTDADGWEDVDEISYMETLMGQPWTDIPDIWHYLDYDMDGVTDFTELNRGTSVLMPDTDMDGLDDWTELFVPASVASENFTLADHEAGDFVINTNTSLPQNERYTSPVDADSDFDGLDDYEEMQYGTDPTHPDSDRDGLSDYEEIMVYYSYEGFMILYKVNLDPLSTDTDADGINDLDEVIMCLDKESATGNPLHGPTGDFDNDGVINVLDYDSDSDGIYDGFEAFDYQDPGWPWYPLGTDMFDSDQNFDGVIDGISTDYDMDGLSDNSELGMIIPGYTYTSLGDENTTYGRYFHLVNHTLCALNDTDGDGFLDGYEINWGSDPLNRDNYPYTAQWTVPDFGYMVDFASASNIENLMFSAELGQIEFDVSGPDGTVGFCNITIPRELLYSPVDEWQVLMDGEPIEYIAELGESTTLLSFSYLYSEHHITIRGTEVLGPSTTITTTETTTTITTSTTPDGFDPLLLIMIGAIVGVVIVVVIIVMKMKKS